MSDKCHQQAPIQTDEEYIAQYYPSLLRHNLERENVSTSEQFISFSEQRYLAENSKNT